MKSFAVTLGAICLGLAVAGAAYLALQSCAVRLPFTATVIGACPSEAAVRSGARLVAVAEANDDLARQIVLLERELAAIQCTARFDPPAAPAVPDAMDERAWQNRDVGVLEGCWELDSDYSVVNDRTGVRTDFTAWSMCFDANGVGSEEMRATNGTTCSGPLSSRFNAAGALVIEEPGNLPCTDNTFIYRRVTECTLTEQLTAACVVRQPEQNRTSTVALRRARGGP